MLVGVCSCVECWASLARPPVCCARRAKARRARSRGPRSFGPFLPLRVRRRYRVLPNHMIFYRGLVRPFATACGLRSGLGLPRFHSSAQALALASLFFPSALLSSSLLSRFFSPLAVGCSRPLAARSESVCLRLAVGSPLLGFCWWSVGFLAVWPFFFIFVPFNSFLYGSVNSQAFQCARRRAILHGQTFVGCPLSVRHFGAAQPWFGFLHVGR